MSNLLPCPACKGAKCMVTGSSSGFGLCGKCTDCAACGPMITQSASCSIEQAAIDAWNAMPRAIEWSSEPPKVAGLYGCMARCRYPNFFNVTQQMVDEAGWDECLWFGPIPMPK